MLFRIRRATACLGVVALATGASIALGSASSGAATAKGSAVTPAAAPTTIGVNGLCGGTVIAPLPPDLRQGSSESNELRLFREKLNYTLTASVPVDFTAVGLYNQPTDLPGVQPTVATGTAVNSYILHSDPPGNNPLQRLHRAATIGFTSDVLGVQVLSGTLTSPASKAQLRAAGVTYPSATSGLELTAAGNGDYARLVNARTVSVSFKTSSAIDEIRVITKATTSTVTALKGYRMVAADGGVFDFGGQQFFGSTGGRVLNQPIVAGVNTCGNGGYWFVARDGGVFSYGDAAFHGSLGGQTLSSPVVGMAATPTGAGYYLVQANGAVHGFGADATTFGDASHLKLNKPIVGMAVTPTGQGYWLVASDGGIFTYGDARTHFYGSTGNIHLVSPIIGMFATLDGLGYDMYAADGGMFVFQAPGVHEPFFGSAGGSVRTNPIVGARLAADGQGYYFTDSAGILFNFGPSAPRATPQADMSSVKLFRPMIGMM
jgi:hypothetical protein